MTTLCWDGRTLAADKMCVHGATKIRVRKLFDCGEYHYACCGKLEDGVLVAEWITAGAKADSRIEREEGGDFGLAIRKSDARAFILTGKPIVLLEVEDEKITTGSGHEYARAAMALGKSAVQAVQFAARFDAFTGFGVDSVRIQPKRKR